MSGPEVWIELDRAEPTYRPGESIGGRVVLRAQGRTIQSVDLTLTWTASGASKPHERVATSLVLIVGPLAARDPVELPFIVPCPAGPASATSRALAVSWELRATTRFEDGAQEAAAPLRVVDARESRDEASRRPRVRDRRLARFQRDTFGQALGGMAFGLFVMACGWWLGGIPCVSSCGAIGALIAVGGFVALRNPLAERRLGRVHLDAPAEVAPGEAVTLHLSFEPPRPLRVGGVEVRLVATEKTEGTSGERTLHEAIQRPTIPTLIHPHEGLSLEIELPLRTDVAPTCEEGPRRLSWALQVRVDVPRWPDWVVTVPLRVLDRQRPRVEVPRLALDLQPGQRCPFCRERVAGEGTGPVKPCGACGTVLHAACWAELTRCPSAGCDGGPRGRTRVR